MATVGGRRRNPRGEGDRLRGTLLDVATEKLAEVADVEALSVRAVTSAAGVSPTALYLHFADKDELVAAVKTRCFAALDERMAAAEAEVGDDPAARVGALGRAYLAFAREQPGWYAAIFHTRFRAHLPPGEDGIGGAGMAVFARLVRAVAARSPELDGETAHAIAAHLWAALHGRVSIQRAMASFPLPDEETWLAQLAAAWGGASAVGGRDATG